MAFLQFWKWMIPYLRDWIHKNVAFQTYPSGKTGIFEIAPPPGETSLRIVVTADWATGTLEAETVAENMAKSSPHCTVHLGDVYYMGEAAEVRENCLGVQTQHYSGVYWPKGTLGSFALMGNHEMYSGGRGYFHTFLRTLGLFNADQTVKDPQSASYFCIELEHWVLLGLDTGYHSGGIPILAGVPGVNKISFLNVDARFDDKMLTWLGETIDRLEAKGSGQKSIVILTHHQPVSAFEHSFRKPATQLAELGFLKGKEFVWLYGHEHRLTVYAKQTIANSLTVYPRCIGHGGMPVEITALSQPNPDILFHDPRQHPIDQDDPDTTVGYNGHLVLVFTERQLTIEYHDILNNELLLTEIFVPTGSGTLHHTISKPPNSALSPGMTGD